MVSILVQIRLTCIFLLLLTKTVQHTEQFYIVFHHTPPCKSHCLISTLPGNIDAGLPIAVRLDWNLHASGRQSVLPMPAAAITQETSAVNTQFLINQQD